MNTIQTTALTLILGTVLIYTGFGAFPPRIYTEKSVREKLNLLAAWPRRWILSQSFVVLGAITQAAGSILLALVFSGSQGALAAKIGAVAFVFGHVFWIWHLGLRMVEPGRFARGELPGWLYRAYSIPTLLALASFGVAFWLQGIHRALGVGIFLGALLVLGLLFKFSDMPPFIYYLMTLAIALTLLF